METQNYKSIASKLDFEGRAFIDGKYVDAIDGQKFENINPATGEVLCTVAKCNYKDVDFWVIRGPRFLSWHSYGEPLSYKVYNALKLENELGIVGKGQVELHRNNYKESAEKLFHDSNIDVRLADWQSSMIVSDLVVLGNPEIRKTLSTLICSLHYHRLKPTHQNFC